jgi:hypothetical protein
LIVQLIDLTRFFSRTRYKLVWTFGEALLGQGAPIAAIKVLLPALAARLRPRQPFFSEAWAVILALETAIAGGSPAHLPASEIAGSGHGSFDVPVAIPREFAIDSTCRDRDQRARPQGVSAARNVDGRRDPQAQAVHGHSRARSIAPS